jgi:hypothetical protein
VHEVCPDCGEPVRLQDKSGKDDPVR